MKILGEGLTRVCDIRIVAYPIQLDPGYEKENSINTYGVIILELRINNYKEKILLSNKEKYYLCIFSEYVCVLFCRLFNILKPFWGDNFRFTAKPQISHLPPVPTHS